MKKSQLRKIIRESIKGLMNEQANVVMNGTLVNKFVGCGNLTVHAQACIQNSQNSSSNPIQVGDVIEIMSSNWPPDTTDALGNVISNVPMWASGFNSGKFFALQVGPSCQFLSGQPHTRPDGYVVSSHNAKINMSTCGSCCNEHRWSNVSPGGYCWDQCPKYRCGHCNTPCTQFVIQNNPGLCSYGNSIDCHEGCSNTNPDTPERWTCMGPDKFGNPQGCKKCNQYEIDAAANGAGWACQHPTENDCLNHPFTINGTGTCSGPESADAGKTKGVTTPFTTTPQSKITEPDDEIERMQDLAKIKR